MYLRVLREATLIHEDVIMGEPQGAFSDFPSLANDNLTLISTIFELGDHEHYLKEGGAELIVWEYLICSHLQRNFGFPKVCEFIVDVPWRPRKGLLHLVCFRDIFGGDCKCRSFQDAPWSWCERNTHSRLSITVSHSKRTVLLRIDSALRSSPGA